MFILKYYFENHIRQYMLYIFLDTIFSNLARIQEHRIKSSNRPFLKVLLRDFDLDLDEKSATEYVNEVLRAGTIMID